MQAAVVAAHFAVDTAGLAPLVIHHGQLGGRGVGGGALGGSAPGLSDDGGVGVPQEGLSEVRLLQHLAALVDNSEQEKRLEQLTLITALEKRSQHCDCFTNRTSSTAWQIRALFTS